MVDIMSYYIIVGKHIEIYGRKARSLRQLCYDGSVATLLFGGGGKTYFNVKKYGVVKHY